MCLSDLSISAQVGQERSTRTPTAARDVADGLHWKTSCITEGKDIRVQIATRGLRLGAMQNQKQCCPMEQGHEREMPDRQQSRVQPSDCAAIEGKTDCS